MNATATRKAVLATSMKDQLARSAYTMSKHVLFNALASGDARINVNGHSCLLLSIQREDGSGNSFNLRVIGPDKEYHTVYTRAA